MAYFNSYDVRFTQLADNDNLPQNNSLLISSLPGYTTGAKLVIRRLAFTWSNISDSSVQTICSILVNNLPIFYCLISGPAYNKLPVNFVNFTCPITDITGTELTFVTTQPSTKEMGFSIDYQFIPNTNPVFNNFISSYGSAIINSGTPKLIYKNSTDNPQYVQSVNLTFPSIPNGNLIKLIKSSPTLNSILSNIIYNQELSNTNSSLSNGGVILMPTEKLVIQINNSSSDNAVNYNVNTINIVPQ